MATRERTKLSPTQQKVWEYLLGYASDFDNGHNEYPSPTYGEIAAHLKYKKYPAQSVYSILIKMRDKRYITMDRRGIKLVTL